MKYFLSIVMLIVALTSTLSTSAEVFKAPTKQTVEFTDTTTNHVYEIQDKQYPIYKTKRGRYYIWKVSKKTNKSYKYYVPKEVQKQIEEHDQMLNNSKH